MKIQYNCYDCGAKNIFETSTPEIYEDFIEAGHDTRILSLEYSCENCNKNTNMNIQFTEGIISFVEIFPDNDVSINIDYKPLYGSYQNERYSKNEQYSYLDFIDNNINEQPSYLDFIGNNINEKGKQGEKAFFNWLNLNNFSYLYINQEQDTFPTLFKSDVKRPDFLILIESIGLIAVDVKNYSSYNDTYSLPYESELKKTLSFERLFRIPVWYAYSHENSWLWISALKALEVGKEKINKQTSEKFLVINFKDFISIESTNDFGKLWTDRLPAFKKNNASYDEKLFELKH